MSATVAQRTEESLRTRSLRGGLVAAAGAWIRFAVQFGTVVIVARILGPEQYGIAAVVLIFTTLAELLRTSGIVNAVIQRPDLTSDRAAALHRVSWVVASLIGIAGALVYAATGGTALYAVLFAGIIASAGFGAIPGALLVREMRTLPLVASELAAAVVGCALAMWLAATGAGGAALVWQAAAYSVLTTAAVLVAGGWRRRDRASLRDVREYLRFGGHSAVTQGARFVSQNTDRSVLAATATAAEAGLYVQAGQLVMLPLAQVTGPLHRVVLPALSRLKDDADGFRRYFRGTAAVMSLTLLPLFATLAVIAEPLITTLFGAQWSGSVGLFRILALNAIGATLVFLSSWVFVATGRARTQSWVTLATAVASVAGVLIGAAHGPVGIAIALATVSISSAVPTFLVARRGTALRMRDLITPMLPGWGVAVSASLASLATISALPASPAVALISGLAASAAGYIVGVAAIPAARRRVTALRPLIPGRLRPEGSATRKEKT